MDNRVAEVGGAVVSEEYLTPAEIAALVRVSVKWVRTHGHRIPGRTKIGHAVRFRRVSVMAALAGGKLLRDR